MSRLSRLAVSVVALWTLVGTARAQTPAAGGAGPPPDPALVATLRESLARPDVDGAAEAYDRLRRADPEERGIQLDPGEYLRLAEAFTGEGRHEEAILQVLRARKLHAAAGSGSLRRAPYVLGRIYADRGDYGRAAEVLGPCAASGPAEEAGSKDRRECRFAAMAVSARLGRFAAAETLASQLLGEATAEEQPALGLFKGLVLHAQGDVRGALALFATQYRRENAPVAIAAYYAIRAVQLDPGDAAALEQVLSSPRAESEPFLSRWARLVLSRRAGRADDPAFVVETLDSVYAERPQLSPPLEPQAAATLRWLHRAVEGEFVQRFMADVARLQWLRARLDPPKIKLDIVGGSRGARVAHVEITLSAARGVRGLTVRASSQSFPVRLRVASLLPSRTEDNALRFFVPVPVAAGDNTVSVIVDMLGDAEENEPVAGAPDRGDPTRRDRIAFRGQAIEPRIQVLVAAVERYAWDRPRVVETARADALRIARALRNIGDGETASVDVLLNEDVTRERLREWVTRPRQPDDLVLVYLRGIETGLTSGLNVRLAFVPSDGRPDLHASLISAPEILSWLEVGGAGQGIIIMDTEPFLPQGEMVQIFYGLVASLWKETGPGTVTLLASKFPLYAPRTSPEHGHSPFVLAFLESLNGLYGSDVDAWNGTLWSGDVLARVRAYFRRQAVITAFSLLQLHRPFLYQSATASFPLAEQSDLLRVFRAAQRGRRSSDERVRELARQAIRSCRSLSRTDQMEDRLELLALLLRRAGDDPSRALREWAAAY